MNNQVPVTPECGDVDPESVGIVEDFRVTKEELKVLARHHAEGILAYEHWCKAIPISIGSGDRRFWDWRLCCIERILGELGHQSQGTQRVVGASVTAH